MKKKPFSERSFFLFGSGSGQAFHQIFCVVFFSHNTKKILQLMDSITIICLPFWRVKAKTRKVPSFERIVLVDQSCNFSHVFSFLLASHWHYLNISIGALTSYTATEISVVVFPNTVPSSWATDLSILQIYLTIWDAYPNWISLVSNINR